LRGWKKKRRKRGMEKNEDPKSEKNGRMEYLGSSGF